MTFCSGYMAPEYAMNGQFSVKKDVYSFGVLMLEVITGKRNYNARSNNDEDTEGLLSWVRKQNQNGDRFWSSC